MLFKLLKKIRQKPEHVRRLIALGVSSGITLIVIGFWVVSYTHYVSERLSAPSPIDLTSSSRQIGDQISTSFSQLKNNIGSMNMAGNQSATSTTDGVGSATSSGTTSTTTSSTTITPSTSDAAMPSATSSTSPSVKATTTSKYLVQ